MTASAAIKQRDVTESRSPKSVRLQRLRMEAARIRREAAEGKISQEQAAVELSKLRRSERSFFKALLDL